MLRAIQEIKPKFVIAENVFGITNIDGGLVFEQVCLDLEAEGYEVQPFIIPACAKNAPHVRQRVWFVAYSNGTREKYNARANDSEKREIRRNEKSDVFGELCRNGDVADTYIWQRKQSTFNSRMGWLKKQDEEDSWELFPTQSPICGRDDGLPPQLDGITFSKWRAESIKGYGNAIVPQVALELFKIIETI